MKPMDIALDDYGYMSQRANAEAVLGRLDGSGGNKMPPGGPYWPDEHLALFRRWLDAGCPR